MIFNNICKSFSGQEIIKNFSLKVPKSSIACLMGPSGCGKTTLLNIAAGLTDPDSGNVEIGGKVSYLFQEPRLLDWKTGLENVSLATGGNVKRAEYFLEKVGLEKDFDKRPCEMSGGMRQRVAIARAFAFESDVILMDEPFQNLDIELNSNLLKTFLEMWKNDRRTVLWVTHDITEAALVSDFVVIVGKNGMDIKAKSFCDIPQSGRNIKNTAFFQAEIYDRFLI